MRLFSTFLIAAAYAKSQRNSWKKLEQEGSSKYSELKKVTTFDQSSDEITVITAQWETSLKEGKREILV